MIPIIKINNIYQQKSIKNMSDYTNTNLDYNKYLSNLLETEPERFLEEIRTQTPKTIEWVSQKCKNYHNWFSPPLHQLVRITGKLVKPNQVEVGSYFGEQLPDGIPEDLALEIFEELKKYNLNPEDTDYYGHNLSQFLARRHQTISNRTGNEHLIQSICSYFQLPEITEQSVEYAAPPTCSGQYPPEEPPPHSNLDEQDSDEEYNYPVPAPSIPFSSIRPPTYDGHFQNFVDNMDEYERELEEAEEVGDFLEEIKEKGTLFTNRAKETIGQKPES